MDISISDVVSAISALVAGFSALYARWSVNEASKANDIGRLNALLAIRLHYLELMARQAHLAEQLNGMQGAENAFAAYAELDTKLGEINKAITQYHETVIVLKKS